MTADLNAVGQLRALTVMAVNSTSIETTHDCLKPMGIDITLNYAAYIY